MKHLLNTLYVTTQGAYLARDGETVAVRVEEETKLRVPVHTLGGIVCFGRVSCSPPLMELCAHNSVMISFLSESGRFMARVQGAVSGNVLLRREQYRWADSEEASSEIARSFVIGKVANCRNALMRAARESAEPASEQALSSAGDGLGNVLRRLKSPGPVETIRGMEGEAAGTYFGAFDPMILTQRDSFFFHGRNRRPPLDNMNALLSFFYTLLLHDSAAALESVGLDPAVGFLHADRPGRLSLALDLMEEFRPVLADRLALSLVNRQQVKGKGFKKLESGAVEMDDATRKEVLVGYQNRKQETIRHPFIDETVSIGLLLHIQARLLARCIRGELEAYPPFIWK